MAGSSGLQLGPYVLHTPCMLPSTSLQHRARGWNQTKVTRRVLALALTLHVHGAPSVRTPVHLLLLVLLPSILRPALHPCMQVGLQQVAVLRCCCAQGTAGAPACGMWVGAGGRGGKSGVGGHCCAAAECRFWPGPRPVGGGQWVSKELAQLSMATALLFRPGQATAATYPPPLPTLTCSHMHTLPLSAPSQPCRLCCLISIPAPPLTCSSWRAGQAERMRV